MCRRVTGGDAFAEPLPGHKSWCLSAEVRKQRSHEGLGGKIVNGILLGFSSRLDAVLDFFNGKTN